MKELEIKKLFKVYDDISEVKDRSDLITSSIHAADRAYAPYSKFNVGAAILMDNGEIITGNNQENAAYPSGLCAERVAIFSASAKYPKMAIRAVAVYATSQDGSYLEPVTPCGACRQAMLEYENLQSSKIPLFMSGKNGKIIEAESIAALLPLSFGSFQLK